MKLKKANSLAYVILVATLLCHSSYAQKTFSVTIEFPPQLAKEKLEISYDTGIEEVEVKPVFKGNHLVVSGEYYSKYASLEIEYPGKKGSAYATRFFLEETPATIYFLTPSGDENPLKNYKTEHAYSHKSMGEEKYGEFVHNEEKEIFDLLTANQGKMNDSLSTLLRQNFDKLNAKEVEFVVKNSDLYYVFYLFRTRTVNSRSISSDSLLHIFTLFPDSLKQSAEGEWASKILQSSKLKKGQFIPGFTATDIAGKIVSLSDYRGKYVLLNFWASWCSPCVAEMPVITAARKRFSEDKLAMVFITQDTDTTAFKKAVKKYNISGTHIFSTDALIKQYGAQAIPVLYVIDPEGRVVYSRDEEEDYELKLLNKVLADRL